MAQGSSRIVVAAVGPAGLDEAFGSGGVVTLDATSIAGLGSGVTLPRELAMAADPTNLITLVARAKPSPVSDATIVFRLSPTGAVVSASTVALAAHATFAGGLGVQPDGKALIGVTSTDYPRTLGVARVGMDGALDPSFAADGTGYLPVFSGAYGYTAALALGPDGTLYVGTGLYGRDGWLIARLR